MNGAKNNEAKNNEAVKIEAAADGEIAAPALHPQAPARRRFLETSVWTVTGLIGVTLFGTGGRFAVGDSFEENEAKWVKVGALATLPVGQMHRADYTMRRKDAWHTVEVKGLLYVYSEDGVNFIALSGVCTHLGCNVHWKEESGGFHCPCHDARFDQKGMVLCGPPPRPLTRLQT
jgi:Rieske Fe-S protein